MRLLAVVVLGLGLSSPLRAQSPEDIMVLKGQCSADSGVLMDGKLVRLHCTAAVISFHENRGSVMLQFAGKTDEGEDRILGFAGPMRSRDLVTIERIYLAGGSDPLAPANRESVCAFLRTGDRLMEARCRAVAVAHGINIETRVRFLIAQ